MSEPDPPFRVLQSSDQAAAAVLTACALVALALWWLVNGGWQGQLVEVERAQRSHARFEVDLNQADWPELMQLPGVGEALAHRIVESREKQGPFTNNGDLRRVHGIGAKKFEKICPYLTPTPSHLRSESPRRLGME